MGVCELQTSRDEHGFVYFYLNWSEQKKENLSYECHILEEEKKNTRKNVTNLGK